MTMLFPLISREPVTPESVPAAYRAAVKAKLKRDRESYRAFRAVDQAEHERFHRQRVAAAVAEAEENAGFYRGDLATFEPAAGAALTAAREAEDRARETAEYARTQRLEYERVVGKASAREETDALLRADAADETAHQAAGLAAQAAEESRKADAALAETREGLAGAERMLDKARKRAQVPAGDAPISDVTVRACTAYMQVDEVWDQLAERDRRRVQRAGEPRPMMSDREWNAMMREAYQNAFGS